MGGLRRTRRFQSSKATRKRQRQLQKGGGGDIQLRVIQLSTRAQVGTYTYKKNTPLSAVWHYVPNIMFRKKQYAADDLEYELVVVGHQNVVIVFFSHAGGSIKCDTITFTPGTNGALFRNKLGAEYDAKNAYLYDLEDADDRAAAERISPGVSARYGSSGGASSGSSSSAAAAAPVMFEDPSAKVAAILAEYRTPMGPLKLLGEKRKGLYTTLDWVDLTDLPSTCTIDDESSEDLDDAISIEETAAVVMLYVHIVDIAHEDLLSKLMQRQQEYCSSMYLPGHTEHLLDAETVRRLSLVQGVVRTAITVKIRLGAADEPCEIFKSLIRVKARLSYTDLRTAIDGGGGGGAAASGGASSSPRSMASSCLDPILRYLLPIAQRTLQPRDDIAYKVVGVAMERANMKVAAYLSSRLVTIPFLIGPGQYSLVPTKHEEMGLYTHFTSPLRRYADVLVHRILAGYTTIPELEAQVTHINERMALIKRLQNEGK